MVSNGIVNFFLTRQRFWGYCIIRVKSDLYLSLEVSPKKIYLGKISHDTAVTRIVRLDYSPEHVKILGIGTSSNSIHVRLLDDKHRITNRVRPQDIGCDNKKISIDCENQDEMFMLGKPFKGQVIGDSAIKCGRHQMSGITINIECTAKNAYICDTLKNQC